MNINLSLSTLRKVIDTLIDNSKFKANSPKRHVPPFRESVLTWVLSDSLGGNSKTMMMTAISPHKVNEEETIGTLRYALRAKAIVCSAKVNEEKSSALVSSMKDEIMKLQAQLRSGGGGGVSEELKKEIEEREMEIVAIEEDFKKKEEEMKQQIEEQQGHAEELKVEVHQRKYQQFADAFRSAFSIKRNQNEMQTAKQLLAVTQAQAEALGCETARLERDMAAMKKKYEEEDNVSKREIVNLQRQVSEKDKITVDLNARLATERDKVADLERRNVTLTAAKKDIERKHQSMQQELQELKVMLDKEKAEITRQKDADQVFSREMAQARDALRRKKDAWLASQVTSFH
jgi:kinesin family protein 3/17